MSGQILVVEDDEDIRNVLKEVLEDEGYTVDVAREGAEALSKLDSSDPLPAFVILDLSMPGVDGFEFRKRQLENPRLAKIPVVVTSAGTQVEEKARRVGAAAVLLKPTDISTVLDLAKRFIVKAKP